MALFPIQIPKFKLKLKKKKKTNTASPKKKKKKAVRIFKLIRKNQQKKNDKQLIRTDAQKLALEKQEAEMSPEFFVEASEAMGPTVYNEGYMKKAAVYRTLRYCITFTLVLFLFGMLNLYREEITIENFRYLMRNVNFELRTEMGDTGSISFTSNDTNVFAIYKTSLVQLSNRQIAIYDPSGRTSYTGQLDYTRPGVCASDKFVLAYDRNGGDYSLYTTFSQAHTASTEHPISDVDLADNGNYAIASRSKEYFGTVEVYNSSFQLVNKIQKNKYIASVDLSADGSMLLIASYYVGKEGVETELMTLAIDSDEPTLLFTLPGILPWEVSWLDDTEGNFVLICEEGVKFFDNKGKIFTEYGFSDKNVIEYTVSASPSRVAIVTREGSDTNSTNVTLLSEKGKLIFEKAYTKSIQATAVTADGLILLFGDSAQLVSDGKTQHFTAENATLLTITHGKSALYFCTSTRAILPSWEKQS